jgi:tetratricopeptide (TPR) repeat protein
MNMEETKPVQVYRCQSCGIESTVKQAFVEKKNLVGEKTKTTCFECEVKRQSRIFLIELVGLAGFGILYYLLDPYGILAQFVLYTFASFLLCIPIILLHELSHAIIGSLMGLRIFAIHLGFGRLLFSTKFLGVRWVVRLVPLGGATLLAGPETRLYRVRLFFAVLAGPALHAVLIVLLYLLQIFMLLITGHVHWIIGLSIWVNIISLLVNLVPHKVSSAYGMTGSDGMKLLHIPRMKRKELVANYVIYHSASAVDAVERKDIPGALQLAQKGLELYPNDLTLVNTLGYVYTHMQDYQKAREIFKSILETQQEIPEMMKYIARNNIAFADVMLEDPSLLQEADEYSAQAYQNMKWEPLLAGTRGAVLVANGKYDEGIELLKVAFAKSLDKSGRASDACFLARAEHRRGDPVEAKKYLEMARKLDPTCILLKKVEQELGNNLSA